MSSGHIGDTWIFPDPGEPSKAIDRHAVLHWWTRLEKEAGLRRVKGRGWHSLRRLFANDSDRAGLSLSVTAKLGGWKGTKTLTSVYIEPDDTTLREGAAKVAKLRASGD